MTATRGLLVDFGGVLTPSVAVSWRAFERAESLPKGTVFDYLARAYEDGADTGVIARYERGEIERETFETLMVADLAEHGHEVNPDRLVLRLFAGMTPQGGMWQVVDQARAAGVATGLLSNSWGLDAYPQDRLAASFDVVVISAEVGVRKPDPRIFHIAAERLGLPPEACAFVDDLDRNVAVADELGMFGVLHHDAATTAAALAGFLGVTLAVKGA